MESQVATADEQFPNRSEDSILRRTSALTERFFKYIMVTPLTVLLLGIAMFPFLYALWLSLTNAKTINFRHPDFVGLSNYAYILTSPVFWKSLIITAIYVGIALTLEIVIGVGLAIAVDNAKKAQRWFVTFLVTPMLISTVMVGIMFKLEVDPSFGVIPYYLKAIGLNIQLIDSGHALMTMIFIDVWQWTSFIFLIAFAGLKALPAEPFEAARVYGSSSWYTLRHVTLPLLKPVLAIAIVFRLMDAFKAFDHIYILTSGGPGIATTTFSILTYNFAYKRDHFGKASAMAIILLIVIVIATKQILKRAKLK